MRPIMLLFYLNCTLGQVAPPQPVADKQRCTSVEQTLALHRPLQRHFFQPDPLLRSSSARCEKHHHDPHYLQL